ncbi:MAG TPA: glycoside hydrolase family 38 C-terminal domain-containing protein [Spirochaetia bacterium]|nr:glycoside hydrolase family 38 C-terminal domain-containing protein [Spirochaetia bacterium]
MNKKYLHMIGNAHIDPVWLWQWQEGYQEIRATFRSALDRMKEYPDFIFTCSSAAFYEWIEESDPEMFAEIREQVREGRWKIVGGWWVQPDCNMPCGESFVRHGLIGQAYFQRAFGLKATVGYNVDSFGHHAMLPQLLSKMGLTRYVFMRPAEHEMGLPGPVFQWESDDGSRVLAYRIPFSYTTWGGEIDDHVSKTKALIDDKTPELMCFYGVGNHGGGPTRVNIETIHRLQQTEPDVEILMSSPEAFFERAEAAGRGLPGVHGELQHHARGCYSAHSQIKQLNRLTESRLLIAERFEVVALMLGLHSTGEDLRRAWKNLLFNQFHDTLAGSAIEPAYIDARDQLGEALSIASRSINRAFQAIAGQIDIAAEEGTKPIVVFNPNGHRLREIVELEFLHAGQVNESGIRPDDELVDENGAGVAWQGIQSVATDSSRTRICFSAEVPALGYRTYRVKPRATAPGPDEGAIRGGQGTDLSCGENWAENRYLRLEIDERSGGLSRLLHKSTDWNAIGSAGQTAQVHRDESDTWSHGVDRYDDLAGEFGGAQVRLVETGPVRAVIRSTSYWGKSTLRQDFVLGSEAAYVEVRVTLNWQEHQRLLKMRFPVNVDTDKATYEVPFGRVVRPTDGSEEPGQRWVDISGGAAAGAGEYGLSLVTDGKHSYSVQDNALCLTVLRSPIFAHHIPRDPDPSLDYRYMDQGEQRFTCRLVPHSGGWQEASIVEAAESLSLPLAPILASSHRGSLPSVKQLFEVTGEGVTVSALKLAEEGEALIVRCYETRGRRVPATISLPVLRCLIRAELGPFEIKTFRIPRQNPESWVEVNLLEEE